MKKLILLLMMICSPVFAHDITQPPVMVKEDKVLTDYLKTISDNFNTPTITTTAPNGNIIGLKGHLIIYFTGAAYQLWVNTDGVKTWAKVGP